MKNLMIVVMRFVVRVLFRVEVHGKWHDLDAKKLLIVANHESFLDGLLLGLFLPVNPVFVVHTWVAQAWFFKPFLMLVDYLAVDPTSPMAMKQVIKLIEAGRPVAIFPEGRITVTGSLMKVYSGPAFVAAKTGAMVLPVRLDGPSRSYFSRVKAGAPRSWFPKMRITILPSETITMPAEGSSSVRRHNAGEQLRRLMQTMIFASKPAGTLYEALLETMDIYGRHHRVIEDMRQVEHSYGEFLKMVLAMARLSKTMGAEGERIGLLLPNLAATLALMIGSTTVKRIPSMLNYTAGKSGIESACLVAQIKTIVTSRAFIETAKLTEVMEAIAQTHRVIYLEDLHSKLTLLDKLWIGLACTFPRLFIAKASPDDAAVTLFTSGSEGTPKGVVLTHRNLLANMAQIRSVIDFSIDDKFLNALPIFHAFGLTAGALLPLLTGTRLFLYPSPLHYRVIPEVFYDRNCSVLFGTSTFLSQYAKYAHPYDFYRLRFVVAGAEKLASAVRDQWFEKFGVRILEGYGATETAPVLAVNTPMAYKTGTVGQFLPGIEHQLEKVPGIDEGGILHVKGPNVMAGYLRATNPGVLEITTSEMGAGWYSTGDIVDVDAEGFVHIKGRLKRFAKIAGEMVSLEVVEKLAYLADPVALHASSSREDASKGEAIVLFTTSTTLASDQLIALAKAHGIPLLAVPKQIRVVASLPLLGTGKTDYVGLKKMAAEG